MSASSTRPLGPLTRWTSLFAVSLLLIACGGESSGGGSSGPPAVIGTVVKGPIVGTNVVAFQGDSEEPVGPPAVTDSEGRFSIRNVTNYRGPVRLLATNGRYINEANNADAALDVPLEAYSIIENSTGRTTVNVTPLTTLAVTQLRRQGGITDGVSISNTNNAIGQAFGISDITRVTPTNLLVKPVTEGELSQADRYGVLLAAIGQLVIQQDLGQTLADVLDAFSDDLEDGALNNTDGILDSALGQLGASNPTLLGTISNQAIQSVANGTGAGASVLEIGRIELTVDAAELAVTDTRTINAIVFPRTSNDVALGWTTDRPDIVNVDQSGVVTAVSPGSAVITATSQVDQRISESILISVRNDSGAVPDPLQDISLVAPATLVRGESGNAVVAPIPATALLRDVQWTTGNPEIVSVAPGGRISALSVGTATITATSGGISKSVDIQITAPALQGIEVSGPDRVVRGGTINLGVQPIPGDAVFGIVQWSTDHAAIANVVGGQVTGVSVGQATITATAGSYTVNKLIDVIPPAVSGLRIEGVTTLQVGAGTVQLTAVAQPSNADTGTLTWSSDNPEIASVNENGVLLPVSAGQTTIRVRSSTNASVEGAVAVTVNPSATPPPPPPPPPPALTGLTIVGPAPLVLTTGESIGLAVEAVPAGAPLGSIVWASTNPEVATVDANGVVVAGVDGTAQILVSSDGAVVSPPVDITVMPVLIVDPINAPGGGDGFFGGIGGIIDGILNPRR